MKKKLLIIGFVWPEPTSSAAGSRMVQLIYLFKDLGYEIHFATSANTSIKSFDLAAIGVSTRFIALNDSSFDTFIRSLNPSIVLFDRFMTEEQFGWRVAEQCPNAILIIDTEDFHGLRKGRELAIKQDVPYTIGHLQNEVSKRELASMYRCDLNLMISEAEIDILIKTLDFKKELLHYLPFLLHTDKLKDNTALPSFNERQHFITIGNFKHSPNFDAVLFLKHNIWPLIRAQLPEAQLHIYGAYASQKVEQLHDEKEGFLIKGFVEDVNTVMKTARVCLAPLRFGAGLKGKLIDAMKNGTPCVMSSIAAEGMFGHQNPNGCVEDAESNFADMSVKLYSNKTLWDEKSSQGFKILSKRFDRDLHIPKFKQRFQFIEENLEDHRQQNFIGQMLQHHTLQSTKFMSKWIEEKNKKQQKP